MACGPFSTIGSPLTLTYGSTTLYYLTNLQGDVVGLMNASGVKVVEYTYDAWGNPLTTTGSMATTLGHYNPLRYRGYVYDVDTGLYYLQSRYYNPEIGRFINADGLVSTGQGVLGNNMFAYCNNNPVMNKDETGEVGFLLALGIAAVVGGVANAISTANDGGSFEECLISGLIGVVSSAAGFGIAYVTGFSPVGSIVARAVSSTICDLGTILCLNGEITGQDVAQTLVDVTIDVCYSTITYYYTDAISNFVTQTLVNSLFDGGVDILETELFNSKTNNTTTKPRPIEKYGDYKGGCHGPIGGRQSYAMVQMR